MLTVINHLSSIYNINNHWSLFQEHFTQKACSFFIISSLLSLNFICKGYLLWINMMTDMRSRNIMSIPDIKLYHSGKWCNNWYQYGLSVSVPDNFYLSSCFMYCTYIFFSLFFSFFFFLKIKLWMNCLYTEKDNHCMLVSLPM